MSRYTVQLRWPIEQRLDDLKLPHEEGNWPQAYKLLGLDDYPIFDEGHRQVLNDKIIRRYYFREIGFETMGQFRWELRERMFSIMPYYNQLYGSEGLVTDPLLSTNLDYTERWTRDEATKTKEVRDNDKTGSADVKTTSDSTSSQTTSDTSHDKNVFNDTPMNGLDTGAIESGEYATNVTFDDATSSGKSDTTSAAKGTSSTSTKSTDDTTTDRTHTGDYDGTKEHNQKGFDGSQSDLLLTYRQTFLNIDREIVDSLNDLFMGLW